MSVRIELPEHEPDSERRDFVCRPYGRAELRVIDQSRKAGGGFVGFVVSWNGRAAEGISIPVAEARQLRNFLNGVAL